jgi:hypothetical protein
MFTMRTPLAIALATATLAFSAGPSLAQVTGTIWLNDTSDNAAACTVCNAGNLLQSNFVVGAGGIDYNSAIHGYTVQAFLNGVPLSNPAIAGDPLNTGGGSHITLSGTVFLNAGVNSIVVTHDDGVVLSIAGFGTVINDPLESSPIFPRIDSTNVTAASAGPVAFTLLYNENDFSPATLAFTVNGAFVPEPSTWAMMLLGFAGLGFAFRQSRRKIAMA